MKTHKNSFNEVLQVVDILKNHNRERRREKISKNAKKTLQEYRKGLAKRGTVDNLITDFRRFKNE